MIPKHGVFYKSTLLFASLCCIFTKTFSCPNKLKIFPPDMKQITLLLFALVCYTSPLLAQDFWEQLNFPDSTDIFSIAVNNQGNIFIGAGSGIYRSTDNGENWYCMGLRDHTFYSMAINNNGDIYAGSNQDFNYPGLFKSIDNGLTWDTLNADIGVYGNIL